MDTPQDQLNSYRYAEECQKKYSNPINDPQFFECTSLLSVLINKYGRKIISIVLNDYKIKRRK